MPAYIIFCYVIFFLKMQYLHMSMQEFLRFFCNRIVVPLCSYLCGRIWFVQNNFPCQRFLEVYLYVGFHSFILGWVFVSIVGFCVMRRIYRTLVDIFLLLRQVNIHSERKRAGFSTLMNAIKRGKITSFLHILY